jgi:transposase-like protein
MRSAKNYSTEFKADAVKLVKEMGYKKAAISIGVSPSTLHGWYKKAFGYFPPSKLGSNEVEASYEELIKKLKLLEKENRYMHEINKVLKKSLGIMGQDNLDILKR